MTLDGVGGRIKHRRHELGLKMTQIFKDTGISTGNLSDIENGKKTPSALTLLLLSRTLNCSTDWLLTGNSHNGDIPFITTESEMQLLDGFRKLTEEDQYEMLAILQIKLGKDRSVKRAPKEMVKSTRLTTSEECATIEKMA